MDWMARWHDGTADPEVGWTTTTMMMMVMKPKFKLHLHVSFFFIFLPYLSTSQS